LPQNGEALFSLFYLGIFSTTAAYLLQTTAQKFTTETKTAIILSTEAFFGMALSVLILSEPLTLRMILGGILIFAAILTSETKGDCGRMRNKYPESLEKDTP
jgi:drug/metabolite transporter (DMT)-like permease